MLPATPEEEWNQQPVRVSEIHDDLTRFLAQHGSGRGWCAWLNFFPSSDLRLAQQILKEMDGMDFPHSDSDPNPQSEIAVVELLYRHYKKYPDSAIIATLLCKILNVSSAEWKNFIAAKKIYARLAACLGNIDANSYESAAFLLPDNTVTDPIESRISVMGIHPNTAGTRAIR